MVIKGEPRIYKDYEVFRQNNPSLLFPEEPVSKRKTYVTRFESEQEARKYAACAEDMWFKYGVRERVYRYVRKSGFVRGRGEMSGKLIPVHNIEVRETISLKTLI